MPLPEGYLPRKGDVLVLHATVKFPIDEEVDLPGRLAVWVELSGDYTPATLISGMLQDKRRIVLDSVAGIHRRSWREGDAVRVKGALPFGAVVCQRGDVVLVALDDESEIPKSAIGGCVLIHCNALESNPPRSEGVEVHQGGSAYVEAEEFDRLKAAGADVSRLIPVPPTTYPIPEHPGIAPRSALEVDNLYRARVLDAAVGADEDERQRIAASSGATLDDIGALLRVYRFGGRADAPEPPPRRVPRFESPPIERLAEHPEDRSDFDPGPAPRNDALDDAESL